MFEQVATTLGAFDSLAFQHPFRFVIGAILVVLLGIFMRKTLIEFPDIEQKRAFKRSVRRRRILIFGSRALIVLLIAAVFAAPYVTLPELVNSEPKAVVILDRTESMQNTDTSGVDSLVEQLSERVQTQTYTLERSSWESVRPYVQEGTPLLLATDGMLAGDGLSFARYASALNVSVNLLDLEAIEPDLGVRLETVPLAAAGVDTPIRVIVEGNEARELEYELIVDFDGQNWEQHADTLAHLSRDDG